MAFTTGSGAYVIDDRAVREDLLDILTNITPTENQITSGLPVGSASNTLHQWLEEQLAAVKTNAFAEGVDASYPTLTNPQRLTNWCQIFRQGYQVSDTERAVNTAAYNDRLKHEAAKALKMIKNDMELAVLRGSMACSDGSATGVRQLKGIKNWLSVTTAQSGVSLSESILLDYLQNAWNQGVNVDEIYVGMRLKRRISGFTVGATKYVETKDRRLVNAVDIYEADASNRPIKLFAHRYETISGDTNYDVTGIQSDLWSIDYLRKPMTRPLAKTGDSDKAEIVTEATLRCLNGFGGFQGSAHL